MFIRASTAPGCSASSPALLQVLVFARSKPQQTGTGLLIRHGEAATASGRTILMQNEERKAWAVEGQLFRTLHSAFCI